MTDPHGIPAITVEDWDQDTPVSYVPQKDYSERTHTQQIYYRRFNKIACALIILTSIEVIASGILIYLAMR